MNDDNTPTLFILIAIIAIFGLGYFFGFAMGEQFSQKETINFCVEKPADCKIKYQFYSLEKNHK